MKLLIQAFTILFLISSCQKENLFSGSPNESLPNSSLTLVKYDGPIAADGCGWLLEQNTKEYKAYELPEFLQIDGLFLNSTFKENGELFYCFSPEGLPYLELTEKLPENLTAFYWSETQCNDPWARTADSERKQVSHILEYLTNQSIQIKAIKIFTSQTEQAVCAACSCGTGRSFVLWAKDTHTKDLTELGFSQIEFCTTVDPFDNIAWLQETKSQFEMSVDATPKRIVQYEYNNQCVFIIEDCYQCPDALTYIYDENKNLICEFGGIDGRSTCSEFFSEATNRLELYSSFNSK